jgi:vancomycin resistance protein YoaR
MKAAERMLVIKMDMRLILLVTFFLSLSAVAAWMDKLERDYYGVKPGVILVDQEVGRMLLAEVKAVVEEMAVRYQKLPVEPTLEKETGRIIPGRDGCIIDVNATVKEVLAAGQGEQVKLVLIKVSPRYRSDDLSAAVSNLGSFETWFHGSSERYVNIKLAARSLNNTIIWPGQSFSFNQAVGPRTPERGYLPAPIILQGSSSMDFGGGVCQVSSTLYNAAAAARLKIVEIHHHSRPVGYVAPGKDATVSYDDLDLKLSNNRAGPVIIKAGVSQGKVWVQISGRSEASENTLLP